MHGLLLDEPEEQHAHSDEDEHLGEGEPRIDEIAGERTGGTLIANRHVALVARHHPLALAGPGLSVALTGGLLRGLRILGDLDLLLARGLGLTSSRSRTTLAGLTVSGREGSRILGGGLIAASEHGSSLLPVMAARASLMRRPIVLITCRMRESSNGTVATGEHDLQVEGEQGP